MWFGAYSCLGTRMWTRGLVRHCLRQKSRDLVYLIFVTWKKSGWDMVSKTMKFVMSVTYRSALGWWKNPCGVLSHFFQRECTSWEAWVGWDRVA